MAQLLGRVFIKVDGDLLRSLPGAKLDLGGLVREPVVGSGGVYGYTEKLKECTVECEVAIKKGDSLKKLQDIADATLTFECDSGQVFIVRDATRSDTLSLSEGEGGKVALKFFGQPAEEA